MKILGIETSCDETAIAVIDINGPKRKPSIAILSNVVLSQIPIHRKFGGVVPHLAKREHQRNLAPILLRALKEAWGRDSKFQNSPSRRIPGLRQSKTKQFGFDPNHKQILSSKFQILNSILEREPELFAQMSECVFQMRTPRIDAIAVTIGPGLEPALWAGVNFAKALSYLWKKPIIPVNHLEGHIFMAMLGATPPKKKRFPLTPLKFPAMALIVSGGHTELALIKNFGRYLIIGETRDDAAGEAFDKVAKMLGLKYPGGPEIAAQAARLPITNYQLPISLPRPMINSNDFDFSFSGLKTAVLYFLRDAEKKYPLAKLRPPIAKEFQKAVVDVLVSKTIRAAKKHKVKTVILGGGVAANALLRETLGKTLRQHLPYISYRLPVTNLTGDNALMIALAAYFGEKRKTWKNIHADAILRLDDILR